MGTNFHTAPSGTAYTAAAWEAILAGLDRIATYQHNVMVSGGGDITFNSSTGQITWSGTIRIKFYTAAGALVENTIAASNVTLSAGQTAYVTLNETDATALTVSTGTSGFLTYNVLVLAHRETTSGNIYSVNFPNRIAPIFQLIKGSDVASANALTVGVDGNYFDITGTTSITSINTVRIGALVGLHFDAILTFTHHATDLILPTGANITTAAGDEAIMIEYDTGKWRCISYSRANGTSVAGTDHTQNTDTGTTSSTFQIDSGSSGPKIKNSSGTLQARNAADDAYVPVDNGPTTSNATAPITSFAGTVSASSTTATFTESADYALCEVGSTLIASGDTRIIIALLGSNQVTLDYTTAWAASTAITSLQDPIAQHKDDSGNVLYFSAATGDQAWLDTSGNVDVWRDKNGNLGVGGTSPTEKLVVSATGYDARVTINGDGVLGSTYPGLELKHSGSEYVRSLIRSDYQNPGTKLSFWTGTTGTTNPTEKMVIDQNGNVLIGTTTSTSSMMTLEGSLSLKEQAAADADTAAYGQIWVKSDTPNELYFTDDAGTDTQLSSHPLDAPEELYTNGPGLDWMGKRVQHYLGEIYWQTIDGKITVETFDEYNTRRKDVSGHVDLVQLDWDKVHTERAIEKYQQEEVEIKAEEAIEEVEIVEKVKKKTTETMYVLDEETGEITLSEKKVPTFVEQPTGKIGKKLKDGVRLDSETGKLYRKRTADEASKMVTANDIPEMPEWMGKRNSLARKQDNKGRNKS